MSPAILLGLSYPLAMSRMAGHVVGGQPIASLIISVAVGVPWLSQVVCGPVYRLMGPVVDERPGECAGQFIRLWPAVLAFSVPPALVVTALVALTTHWPAPALAAHFLLLMENMVFAQSLMVADLLRRRRHWALGWVAYAASVLLLPTAWYLPPLLATVTQVVPLVPLMPGLLRPQPVPVKDYVADMGRGLVLGGVLWADKLLLFLTVGTQWHIALAYLCLQPAVLGYTFYFAIATPRVTGALSDFHQGLESVSIESLHDRSRYLTRLMDRALVRAVLVEALGVAVVLAAIAVLAPASLLEAFAVSLGSALLAALTLLAYEIDHAGDPALALWLSAAHLLAALASFTLVGGLAASFAATALVDVALIAVSVIIYRARWSSPEYSFFWRKALSW
ncbi:beta-carotene 15,15'-monooxygenase [Actinomyces sp. 594]|uniref:beta-carotene 15,15'-monooxygenase n=1 Tax=Actinomyces sp. 594 TaxID=2057793 RepID=UPI001C59E395|nr:beta-carotene 15,15'-monooxygenase [Actinomyces sp. 594]MBW3068035.1 beta-carotene 15,15'-monooxygenase [Actinomyces sp. 594]